MPSHLYRYSFEPNPDWSARLFARPGDPRLSEVGGAQDTTSNASIKFENEVTRAEFVKGQWHIETSQGPQGAFDAVLTAVGVLHHPVYPDIAGLDEFEGASFHTSRWDHSVTLEGKRVGIIGTGSTATQIVGGIIERGREAHPVPAHRRSGSCRCRIPQTPTSRRRVSRRPRLDGGRVRALAVEFNSKFAAAVVGANPAHYEVMRKTLRGQLARQRCATRQLRAKLTPNYKVGCKRLIMSDRFYGAIQQPNAELVTDGIERIEAKGMRTVDGRLHELDVLVLATGFDTHRFVRPMNVIGRDGSHPRRGVVARERGLSGHHDPGLSRTGSCSAARTARSATSRG